LTGIGTFVSPYASVQRGLDEASDSTYDTVVVRPGTYVGTVSFPSHAVMLRSEVDADTTIIDFMSDSDLGSVYFPAGPPDSTVLDGFTITNAYGRGV
jgi:hypothetical protein